MSKLPRTAKIIQKALAKTDAYLNGEYDPKEELRKSVTMGTAAVLVAVSLLTGLAFSNPADITEEQAAANYRPAPIVMDIDEFVNAPVDDDGDDADEEKSSRIGIIAKFRQAVLSMPQSVRLLIITPLWLIGTALMTLISFLWNVIFASPLGAFIASFAAGLAVLLGLFTATAKILFPDVPLKDLLNKRNVIILMAAAFILSCVDAVAPVYWHNYPLASGLLKLVFGVSVIGLLSSRVKKLFNQSSLS
ncbi:MAG: hypothetical protein IJH43_05780 [Mogibacterium sp.]|nr:hypothetical protein [Mogibacterium sp.]